MSKHIQAVRGMNDILPEETPAWRYLEEVVRQLLDSYGYHEIRMPIVEKTELFKRSIGEVTDIVEKEMYTFEDRNGDMLTLRPEGTAGCVRAAIQNGMLHNQTQRLWYRGPMFRHERPQKGRYRQFHQIGVEVFGLEGPDVDAEHIMMTARLWKMLGLQDDVILQLNSLGSSVSRTAYRAILVEYLWKHVDSLDADSKRRLDSNPLRVLDSKNPAMREIIDNAPKLNEHLDEESQAHFDQLCGMLDAVGIKYQINPCLVRGLDYYGKTVFEWVTDKLGAQGTVCAGGRFDGLVEQLGGKSVPAVGFAMGVERLVSLLELEHTSLSHYQPHAYMVLVGEAAQREGLVLGEQLRDALPQLRLEVHCGGGSFKSQFKKADKSGAPLALIIGEEEMEQGSIGIKFLREKRDQQSLPRSEAIDFLADYLAGSNS